MTWSPEQRRNRMAAIKAKDTAPEMAVRRALHAMGYRFRLHRRDLPGRPDVVLPRHRVVILVHGCFWHQHPDPACPLRRSPKANTGYWGPKLARNVARDASNEEALRALGWRVLVVWECGTRDEIHLRERLLSFLQSGDQGLPAEH
jgi:DNA mismatch endonuclease, patch repair protein